MPMNADLSLYLVTDRRLAGARGVLDTVAAALAGGVTIVQVRSPEADGRDFVAEVRAVMALARPCGVPVIVNDRVDVAQAAGADGVHVGQDDLDARDVRAMIGPDRLLGLSVGSPTEWQTSREALAVVDYIGCGPVRATRTKADAGAEIGLEGLRSVRALCQLPMVAIGGIDRSIVAGCIGAGVEGVAVVSAIMAAEDPRAAAAALLADIRGARA